MKRYLTVALENAEVELICYSLYKQAFREAEIAIDLGMGTSDGRFIRLWKKLKQEQQQAIKTREGD